MNNIQNALFNQLGNWKYLYIISLLIKTHHLIKKEKVVFLLSKLKLGALLQYLASCQCIIFVKTQIYSPLIADSFPLQKKTRFHYDLSTMWTLHSKNYLSQDLQYPLDFSDILFHKHSRLYNFKIVLLFIFLCSVKKIKERITKLRTTQCLPWILQNFDFKNVWERLHTTLK